MAQKHTGRCLCGAVTLSAEIEENHYHICHCDTCRKWNSGPQFAVNAGADVAWTGEEQIGLYSSSDWAERGFCQQCGTHLFYRLKEPRMYFLSLALLDNTDGFTMAAQLCIDNKPEHYAFANQCHMMSEAELQAQFGG